MDTMISAHPWPDEATQGVLLGTLPPKSTASDSQSSQGSTVRPSSSPRPPAPPAPALELVPPPPHPPPGYIHLRIVDQPGRPVPGRPVPGRPVPGIVPPPPSPPPPRAPKLFNIPPPPVAPPPRAPIPDKLPPPPCPPPQEVDPVISEAVEDSSSSSYSRSTTSSELHGKSAPVLGNKKDSEEPRVSNPAHGVSAEPISSTLTYVSWALAKFQSDESDTQPVMERLLSVANKATPGAEAPTPSASPPLAPPSPRSSKSSLSRMLEEEGHTKSEQPGQIVTFKDHTANEGIAASDRWSATVLTTTRENKGQYWDTSGSSSFTGSSFGEIEERNARHFPPRLPSRSVRPKSSAVGQIMSWVTRYEEHLAKIESQEGRPHNISGASSMSADMTLFRKPASHQDTPPMMKQQREIEDLWQSLKRKRQWVRRTRLDLKRKREDLREFRREVNDMDNTFMRTVRIVTHLRAEEQRPNPDSIALLTRRLDETQRLRDQYQYRESEYEGLERLLNEEETLLDDLETGFFDRLASIPSHGQITARKAGDSRDDFEDLNQVAVPFILLGVSANGPGESVHPLYQRLANAVGELQIAREEQLDMVITKESYDFDMQMQKLAGRAGVPEEVEEFYADYQINKEDADRLVEECEHQMSRLKQLCETRGVMRKHLSPYMKNQLYGLKFPEEIDLGAISEILAGGIRTLAHGNFPKLQFCPDHVLASPQPLTVDAALREAISLPRNDPSRQGKVDAAAREFAFTRFLTDFDPDVELDFVNRWLLYNLFSSKLNVYLLHSTFERETRLEVRNASAWQDDVLYRWWEAPGAKMPVASVKNATIGDSRNVSLTLARPSSRAASLSHAVRTNEPWNSPRGSRPATVF